MMSSTPDQRATLTLPRGSREAWTAFMQGRKDDPAVVVYSPFRIAMTEFGDGVRAVFQVLKAENPGYSILSANAFDASGVNLGYIDTSDWQDFLASSIDFDIDGTSYRVEIVEES